MKIRSSRGAESSVKVSRTCGQRTAEALFEHDFPATPPVATMIRCTFGLVRSLAIAFVLGTAFGAMVSCGSDDPIGPTDEPPQRGTIQIGDTVAGVLASAEPHRPYYFHGTGSAKLVLLASATGGDLEIAISDSSTGRLVTEWTVADGSPFASTVSPIIRADTGAHALVVKSHDPGAVRYQVAIRAFGDSGPPERAAATIAIGMVVDNEALDDAADVDEYVLDVAAGDEFIVYLQGRVPGESDRFEVGITLPGAKTATNAVIATASDPDPESDASGRIMVANAGTVRLRVRAYTDFSTVSSFAGPYRLEVARIDRAPEQIDRVIIPGDTVAGEAIDRVGDVDEFTLTALQGEEYKVFFQAESGPASNAFRLAVAGPGDDISGPVGSVGTDTLALLERATGTFRIPADGSYTVRVSGERDRGGLYRGAYRFFVYRIDHRPEHAAAVYTAGDTISGESIELPGDVDEFTLTNPATTLFNLEVWRLGGAGTSAPRVTLQALGGGAPLASAYAPFTTASEAGSASGRIVLPAGSYMVKVEQGGYGSGYWGPYRVMLNPIDSLPERRAMAIAVGDTIEGSLDPAGDIDVYTLAVERGDHYDVFFQGSVPYLIVQTGESAWDGFDTLGGSGATLLTSRHTIRLDAARDGFWHFRVETSGWGRSVAERGPYRFLVVPVGATVEHHSPTIAIGDTITDETLDSIGDVDEFALVGSPGEEAIIYFMPTGGMTGLSVEVFDIDTKEVVREMGSSGAKQATARFRLPSNGRIGVRVYESRHDPYNHELRLQGPYWVAVIGVDRTPEDIPASIAVGDLISGESIHPTGDVDEFTFPGVAGQRLRAYLGLVFGSPEYDRLRLEVSPVGSETVLAAVETADSGPTPNAGTDVITLPATGTYVVRVRELEEREVTAPIEYMFQLRLEPSP